MVLCRQMLNFSYHHHLILLQIENLYGKLFETFHQYHLDEHLLLSDQLTLLAPDFYIDYTLHLRFIFLSFFIAIYWNFPFQLPKYQCLCQLKQNKFLFQCREQFFHCSSLRAPRFSKDIAYEEKRINRSKSFEWLSGRFHQIVFSCFSTAYNFAITTNETMWKHLFRVFFCLYAIFFCLQWIISYTR